VKWFNLPFHLIYRITRIFLNFCYWAKVGLDGNTFRSVCSSCTLLVCKSCNFPCETKLFLFLIRHTTRQDGMVKKTTPNATVLLSFFEMKFCESCRDDRMECLKNDSKRYCPFKVLCAEVL
jgi:hypothetical protein